MSTGLIRRAEEIMRNASVATIAKIDASGYPSASTISSIRTDGIKTAWFATGLRSRKSKAFRQNSRAGVCYRDEGNNITLTGTVDILTDAQTKRDLWVDWFIDHFPEGAQDPNYCVLRFTTQNAALWIDGQYEEVEL